LPKLATLHEMNGQSFTLRQWASIYGVPVRRVTARMGYGWTLERALTQPCQVETITYRNQTLTLAQWSDKTGLQVDSIRQRLRAGWPPSAVLTTPTRYRAPNGHNSQLTHDGMTLSLEAWADRIGVKPATLRARLRKGWSVTEALTTPNLMLIRPSRAAKRGEGSELGQGGRDRRGSTARDLSELEISK
jgi:lambda repressor-like predicted transcriptional regulator